MVDLKLARNVSLSLDYSRLSFQFWADRPAILKSFVSLTSSFLVSPSANWHFFVSMIGVWAFLRSAVLMGSIVPPSQMRPRASIFRPVGLSAVYRKIEFALSKPIPHRKWY